MSLFGVKQCDNFLTSQEPNQPPDKTTAAFDAVTHATEEQLDGVIKVEPAFLLEAYELKPDALLTVNGIMQIGSQLFGRAIPSLTPDVVLSAAVVNQLRSRISELNKVVDYDSDAYEIIPPFHLLALSSQPASGA